MIFNLSFFIFSIILSYTDCTKFRIPNSLVITLFIFLVTFGYLESELNMYSFLILLFILIFFVIIMIVFPKITLGGGDIKYYMVIAIYLEPMLFPLFLIVTGIVQTIFLIYKQNIKKRRFVPMAPAIFFAVILTLIIDKLGYY